LGKAYTYLSRLASMAAVDPQTLVHEPAKLLAFCEEWELEGQSQDKAKIELMYCYQLLAHLMLNDTTNARYLWKRVPASLKKSSATLQACWKLATALIKKDSAAFWAACEGGRFGPLQPLVTALRDTRREHVADQIDLAYSSVSLVRCAGMLGVSKEDAKKLLVGRGCGVDEKADIVIPTQKTCRKNQTATLEQLEQLSRYVAHLEEKFYADLPVDYSKFEDDGKGDGKPDPKKADPKKAGK